MAIKSLIQHYTDSNSGPDNGGKEKHIVSARIHSPALVKLESLAHQFGTKKSSLAAVLLEAAIDEAWEEANRDHS
jgi:hypothetical protein